MVQSASLKDSMHSKQVMDQLTEHLAVYNAKARQVELVRDQSKGGQRASVLKWISKLNVKERRAILTFTDKIWTGLLHQMIIKKRKGSDRFLILPELVSTKTKYHEQNIDGFMTMLSNAICARKSSDFLRRSTYRDDKSIERHVFLYASNAVYFDSFSVTEELASEMTLLIEICDFFSFGQFLRNELGTGDESEWLKAFGYYSIDAFIVNKIEHLILKAWRSRTSGKSKTFTNQTRSLDRKSLFRQDQLLLARNIALLCSAKHLSAMKDLKERLSLLQMLLEQNVEDSHGMILVRDLGVKTLDVTRCISNYVALKVMAEVNEQLLMQELAGEDEEKCSSNSSAQGKRKKKKKKKKKAKPKEDIRMDQMDKNVQQTGEANTIHKNEIKEGDALVNTESSATSNSNPYRLLDQTSTPVVENKKPVLAVVSNDNGLSDYKEQQSDNWHQLNSPDGKDKSLGDIFGTDGASFYWSSADLGIYNAADSKDSEDESVASWTSSRKEFVLGDLLDDRNVTSASAESEDNNSSKPARLGVMRANSHTFSRSNNNSPRAIGIEERRKSLEQMILSPRSKGSRSMGPWSMQRRLSEGLTLAYTSTASPSFASVGPPRSLLRKMLNAFGPPKDDSPYKNEYIQRKKFWERRSDKDVLRRLGEELLTFKEQVLEDQVKVSSNQRAAVEQIMEALLILWPRARVKVFGSVASGLSLPSSDMDLVVWLPPVRNNFKQIPEVGILESGNETQESRVQQLARHLLKYEWVNQDSLHVIDKTAIPLVSIKYKGSHCEKHFCTSIDVSFQTDSHRGLATTALVRELMAKFPQLTTLVLVLKAFLCKHKMAKAYTGGLSSYCLTLLITSFLLHHQHAELGESPPSELAKTFLDFLHFFGVGKLKNSRFSLSEGISKISEDKQRIDPLCVEDPLNDGTNVGQNCFRILQIQKVVCEASSRAEELLHTHHNSGGGDLLSHIFGCKLL